MIEARLIGSSKPSRHWERFSAALFRVGIGRRPQHCLLDFAQIAAVRMRVIAGDVDGCIRSTSEPLQAIMKPCSSRTRRHMSAGVGLAGRTLFQLVITLLPRLTMSLSSVRLLLLKSNGIRIEKIGEYGTAPVDPRRQIEIGNDGVQRIPWIERAGRDAVELLILPDRAEGDRAVGLGCCVGDARDSRLRGCRATDQPEDTQCR